MPVYILGLFTENIFSAEHSQDQLRLIDILFQSLAFVSHLIF